MYPRRHEVVRDKLHHLRIRPHLGIQPSAAPSHRRGAEVEENRLVLLFRLGQHRVHVVSKFDFHRLRSPFENEPRYERAQGIASSRSNGIWAPVDSETPNFSGVS